MALRYLFGIESRQLGRYRSELTALERDNMIAEWVELIADKPAQLAQVSGGKGNKGGESEAARQLGIDRDDVRRARKVASLSPAVT